MTFWGFAHENPIFAIIIIWMLVICPLNIASDSWQRYLRSRNIQAHGWPTPPMDADGDIITEENEDGDLDETEVVVEPAIRPRPGAGGPVQ